MKENNKRKKVIIVVAFLIVLFLAANVYAAAKGYNNIFFIIKKAFTEDDTVATKDEILKDRDITISYKNIEIADGLFIQINGLTIENNKGRLHLTITENESEVFPNQYSVKEKSNNDTQLAKQAANRKDVYGGIYQEIIELKGIKDNTNILSLEVFDNKGNSISLMDID